MPAPLLRRLLPVALGLYCCSLAACKSTSGSSKPGYAGVVDYTTPETNLSQEEYPFDEKGNYLPDVVSGKKKGSKNKATSKIVANATFETPPEPTPVLPTPALAASSPANYETPPESSPYQPDTSSGSTASTPSAAKPTSTTKPKPKPSTTAAKPKPKPKSSSSTAKAKPKPKPKPTPKKPSTLTYTVKKGDTLYELADRYNTTVAAIKKASGLSSNLLRDGRTLRIPRK